MVLSISACVNLGLHDTVAANTVVRPESEGGRGYLIRSQFFDRSVFLFPWSRCALVMGLFGPVYFIFNHVSFSLDNAV